MCVGSVRGGAAPAPHACAAGALALMHAGQGLHTLVARLQRLEIYLNCIAVVSN
jgi:hypothetical protein